ncbi:hypothetical protein BGX26_008913, partial [Mortierella sp. AD094]
MTGGNPKTPPTHQQSDGQDGEKKNKKQKPNQDNAGPSQEQGSNPATPLIGGNGAGKPGGSTFVYKRDQGLQGMKEAEDGVMEDMEESAEDHNMVTNEWHQ